MSSTGHAAGIDLGAVLRAERDINGAGEGGGQSGALRELLHESLRVLAQQTSGPKSGRNVLRPWGRKPAAVF